MRFRSQSIKDNKMLKKPRLWISSPALLTVTAVMGSWACHAIHGSEGKRALAEGIVALSESELRALVGGQYGLNCSPVSNCYLSPDQCYAQGSNPCKLGDNC